MPDFASPLRYPGGKEGLAKLLAQVIDLNRMQDSVYAEPYAGGAGAALRLLFGEHVSRILINDLDYCIAAFWQSILSRTGQFLEMVDSIPITLDEWTNQRDIYLHPQRHSRIRVGFATFFLNRCNRSGILMDGGPIGGVEQSGKWKIDARYYRKTMRQRIEKIVRYRDRIEVTNLDAIDFLKNVVTPTCDSEPVFVYLDPPYYDKGNKLYLNSYEHADHAKVASFLQSRTHPFSWILSYDNAPQIRKLYKSCKQHSFGLTHTAYERRAGKELLIRRDDLVIPRQIKHLIHARKSVS